MSAVLAMTSVVVTFPWNLIGNLLSRSPFLSARSSLTFGTVSQEEARYESSLVKMLRRPEEG